LAFKRREKDERYSGRVRVISSGEGPKKSTETVQYFQLPAFTDSLTQGNISGAEENEQRIGRVKRSSICILHK